MPSWLPKIGKHERDRSGSVSGRSRSPSFSGSFKRSRAISASYHGNPSVNVIPPVPSVSPNEMGELVETKSTTLEDSPGPNVTVVPPSPATTLDTLPSQSSDKEDPKKRHHVPPDVHTAIDISNSEDVPTPRPTAVTSTTSSTLLPTHHRDIRRQASESSIRSKASRASLHIRATTSPNTLLDSNEPEVRQLVDSPEADIPLHEQIPSDNTIKPVGPPSIHSAAAPPAKAAGAGTERNNPVPRRSTWNPKSKQKKPTGLAAAIAGSSFAMVNPHGGNMTLPQSLQSKEDRPPVPQLPSGITTDASSTSQAKRASLSAGALPLSSGNPKGHKRKSSSGDTSSKHTRRSTTAASSSPTSTKKKKNRRAFSEYASTMPSMPSASGASVSTPGLPGSSLGLRADDANGLVASPVQSPSLSSPQSNNRQDYFSGHDVHPSGASSVGDWTTSEEEGVYSEQSESEDETSSEGSDDDVEKELAGLDLDSGEMPTITGFAVASSRRNLEFHELFPTVPDGDYLIDDYGCALQREILIQGRLYVSENHVCFHANILGWITNLSVPVFEIATIEKKMTAFVIPNAIQITTQRAKYTFASFLARDTTYDVIYNVWRSAKAGSAPAAELPSPEAGSGPPLLATAAAVQMPNGGPNAGAVRKATKCACGVKGEHYPETAMEIVIPGTPERIYNLMFASGFIKEFLRGEQKLADLQMSDWTPVTPGSQLLSRNMTYIKPLNASVGPSKTKCEINDEVVHCDFDNYVSTVTTTRTPDVPSGGVFSVKTRTCIMWASAVSTRVVVTTQVEWTGRSFIKGIIERSCIEGQKTFHADLDRAMRVYIQDHQSEFIPEGVDAAAASAQAAAESPVTDLKTGELPAPSGKQREHERNERAMQWAYDTFAGAARVAKDSTKGAMELVADAWDQSSSTTILWFVIVLLVISNLATFFGGSKSMRDASHASPPLVMPPPVYHQPMGAPPHDWVKEVVREIYDEMRSLPPQPDSPLHTPPTHTPTRHTHAMTPSEIHSELESLTLTLEEVERQVLVLRAALAELKGVTPSDGTGL